MRIVFPEDEPTFLVTPNQLEPLSPAEERELFERLLKQCGPEDDEPTFLVRSTQLEPLSPAEERELYERLLKQCGPEDEERDIRDALPEPFE